MCVQTEPRLDPSLFFSKQTLLSSESPKPPADMPSSCPRARRTDGSPKSNSALEAELQRKQLEEESTHRNTLDCAEFSQSILVYTHRDTHTLVSITTWL